MVTWLLFNIHTINTLYAIAGLGLLVLSLVLIFDYCKNEQALYIKFVAPFVWWIVLLVTIGGTATTLLYSEVFGFIPCSLCWLQRIALYPQVLIGLVAHKIKDAQQFPLYGMALSVFGFAVGIYQYIYQMLPHEVLESGLVPCLADGSADCGTKVMEVFGFVTFPLLSAFIFVFLFVVYAHMRRANK